MRPPLKYKLSHDMLAGQRGVLVGFSTADYGADVGVAFFAGHASKSVHGVIKYFTYEG